MEETPFIPRLLNSKGKKKTGWWGRFRNKKGKSKNDNELELSQEELDKMMAYFDEIKKKEANKKPESGYTKDQEERIVELENLRATNVITQDEFEHRLLKILEEQN